MSSTPDVRVVLVGRAGPVSAALAADRAVAIVRQVSRAGEAVSAVRSSNAAVVVVDLDTSPDGVQAVEQLMAHRPTPVLVVGGSTSSAGWAREAVSAGAVDTLSATGLQRTELAEALSRRVHWLDGMPVMRHPRGRLATNVRARSDVAVGLVASTGGPVALRTVLAGVGVLPCPVLVVQHIHPDFVNGLVASLAAASSMPVEVAAGGMPLVHGVVYVAPGDAHLTVREGLVAHLDLEPATLHRPSGDELLSSLATHCGRRGIGAVLTGMGDDGARGLLALREAGGTTIAQDEATSAVFGMPRAAQRLQAAAHVLAVDDIAAAIRRAVNRCVSTAATTSTGSHT